MRSRGVSFPVRLFHVATFLSRHFAVFAFCQAFLSIGPYLPRVLEHESGDLPVHRIVPPKNHSKALAGQLTFSSDRTSRILWSMDRTTYLYIGLYLPRMDSGALVGQPTFSSDRTSLSDFQVPTFLSIGPYLLVLHSYYTTFSPRFQLAECQKKSLLFC